MAKILTGIVTSTKIAKTVTVRVQRVYRHSLYRKTLKKHKKFLAHNDNFDLKENDMVKIQETRPLSKNKHFKVIEKI